MIMWAGLAALMLAFGISVLATPLARRLAFHYNLIDVPAKHKAHAKPIPLLGGCAIFAAILGPSLLTVAICSIWTYHRPGGPPAWLPASIALYIPGIAFKGPMVLIIMAGAAVLHVLGIIDDRKALGPWIKLAVQFAVAAGTVYLADVRVLTILGEPWSSLVTIVWLVLITNSFNFLDNMDGLAAGVAGICAVALLGASLHMGQIFVSAWLCLIIGAVGGFLLYNFPPASVFMGDAGSLVIGFMMAVVSCLTTYTGTDKLDHYAVFEPLVLMALPLYDTCSVMLLRIRERRNPMIGDRRHFSHRLVRRGMSTRSAVLTIYVCTAGTAIAASLLPHVDQVGAVLVFGQTLAILLILALLESSSAAKPQ